MSRDKRPNKSEKTHTRLRGTSLLVVATGLYLAAVVGSLYTLENAYYIPAKREYTMEEIKSRSYFDFGAATLTTLAMREYATAAYREERPEVLERLKAEAEAKANELLASSPVITRVQLLDSENHIMVNASDLQRLRTQHDFSNSLLTRTFEPTTQQSYTAGDYTAIATLQIYYTTAKNDPGIREITTRYRWIMIGFFVTFTAIYYFLLRYLLLPLSRVLRFMEQKRESGAAIIPRPKSQLERAYNNLARDATLTRLSKELREMISSEGLSHVEPVLRRLPELLQRIVGIDNCQVWRFVRPHSTDRWEYERAFSSGVRPKMEDALKSHFMARIKDVDPGDERGSWNSSMGEFEFEGQKKYFMDILDISHERLILFVIPFESDPPDTSSWQFAFYARVGQELRYAISSVEEQRRMILQEKSKANISLSRNLGHDLTNIIATSKLELMNIRAFLAMNPEDVKSSPNKQKIFQESLEALLNNTRFLQEIVNLYRSFSYLQKPNFEIVDISALTADVTALYRLSITRRMNVETNLAEDLPRTRVEPRLLRLALFNILTNAADAIKRATSVDNPEGTILITTNYNRKLERIEITVEDTGPGICDSDGTLLNQDQISEIFRLGYSTKSNQEGEGLGLNWVQTIVHEFHGGEIIANNRAEGGASFMIRLPVLAAKDAPTPNIELIPSAAEARLLKT